MRRKASKNSDGTVYRDRGRLRRGVTVGRETTKASPGLARMIASRIALLAWPRSFRRLVGMTTIARCHPDISWVAGIRASAVTNTSNRSRSAAANNSPFSSERHDICRTVRASWPTKICRNWTGRHSSMRMRKLGGGFYDLVRRQGQNGQYILPFQAGPGLQYFINAQPVRQIVEQHSNWHPRSAKTGRSAHHGGIDGYQIGCLHGSVPFGRCGARDRSPLYRYRGPRLKWPR